MLDQTTLSKMIGKGFSDDATYSFAPSGNYYTDPQIFDVEIKSIFEKEWNYFCHQTQIEKPGQYIVGDIVGESIYAVRGKDNEIRAFYNVCQHRGHQLLSGEGKIRGALRCPYHSWMYDLEGNLKSAPKCEFVKDFDQGSVKLSPIRVEVIGGFVFVNLDPDAISLRESAPTFESTLLATVAEASELKVAMTQTFEINANWKVVTENFLEAYHVLYSGPHHVKLADAIDTDTYNFTLDGKVFDYLGAGGSADILPYETDGKRKFTGREQGLQQIFLWPNVAFSVFPGANMLFVFLIKPTSTDWVTEEIIYFSLDGTVDAATESAVTWVNEQLGPEDVVLVESVQRGLKSKGYQNRGRLMVDHEQKEGWSELVIHHFNMLNLEALSKVNN